MPATIVHSEIPADNIERANKSYGSVFGWKMEKVPEMDFTGCSGPALETESRSWVEGLCLGITRKNPF